MADPFRTAPPSAFSPIYRALLDRLELMERELPESHQLERPSRTPGGVRSAITFATVICSACGRSWRTDLFDPDDVVVRELRGEPACRTTRPPTTSIPGPGTPRHG